jgi:hypothetical protein
MACACKDICHSNWGGSIRGGWFLAFEEAKITLCRVFAHYGDLIWTSQW